MSRTLCLPAEPRALRRPKAFSLAAVREDVMAYCERLRDRDGRHGAYRMAPRRRCDLYSSCDVAILRTIMGEDLAATQTAGQRREWCEHINSFRAAYFDVPADGSYSDTFGHSRLHANGTVIGALGVLGGKQASPVSLYAPFETAEKAGPWLDSLNWASAWNISHLFWGGVHCFSFSARAEPGWLDAVFAWLNANVDESTGWWRRGTAHANRHQGLGGAAHLFPLYEHHRREYPIPERVIDSVLDLQLPDGTWLDRRAAADPRHVMHYLELDALYALVFMGKLEPAYRRGEVLDAVRCYGEVVRRYYARHAADLYQLHPHVVLGSVGIFGLLQQLLPEEFSDSVSWTDIFSDRRLYRTAAVEVANSL